MAHDTIPCESPEAKRYRDILDGKIKAGQQRAAHVLATIARDTPKDQILTTRAVEFVPSNTGLMVHVGRSDAYAPTDYALGQIAERGSVPGAYLRELARGPNLWQQELACRILTDHYSHAEPMRLLARSVNGQLRGWLSDKFRRLDSRPLVDALAAEAQNVGAIPCDGTATETRVALKVIVPHVLEPVPGEFVVFGGEWSNSDYGNGVHGFRAFALRVVCLNGMTRENMLRQVHIGGKLSEDVAFSDRTYRLDTAASVSALRDIVRSALSPAGIEATSAKIREAHGKDMNKGQLQTAVKALDKSTQKAIVDAFASEDVINLPAGNTAWRASNAVSWIARHTDDPEKKLDLERLAGSLA